ncbi:MAG TPA: ABC transporter ATP-binding protein [Candidatus Saccharimonadales bacterium]|jgi:ABC-2 type transport system ATP-binding protein|nr:ABC transporter ATP-binding protein [Candidatus Saccharimonadales bacterium]
MSDDIAVKVDGVSKTFKLPHEKNSSLKSVVINFYKRNKSYEKQKALQDISFEIKKGEFFGIVGRNGSGKSTLLKLLAGIYSPSRGGITINGKLIPFIELGVGFNPELTGRENVFLNGALLGFNRSEMTAMYEDIVEFAELRKFMDQKLKNYSSGMQVRLAFSIAIRAQGDILLLDEVLAVGDAAFQQKCFDYFETLKREKKTVIFVSHDMTAVTRFCTRGIYIEDGEVKKAGDPIDIAELYKMENLESSGKGQTKGVTSGPKLSSLHSLGTEILDQTEDNARIKFTYTSKDNSDMYVAFSVLMDGISVAELTTYNGESLKGSSHILYDLDMTIFNPGAYQITSALCRFEGRKLLAIGSSTPKFSIGGEDMARGAAMKLADKWTRT